MYDSHDKENNELYREFLNFKKSKQQNNNNDDDENTPLTKQIKPQKKEVIALKTEEEFIKQKKPKTAKQMEQFKIAQEKRKQNIEQKKLQKKILSNYISKYLTYCVTKQSTIRLLRIKVSLITSKKASFITKLG